MVIITNTMPSGLQVYEAHCECHHIVRAVCLVDVEREAEAHDRECKVTN